MGGSASVELAPDSDSLAEPGTKVVLSNEITDVDYDEFISEVIEFLRYPIPMHEWSKEALVKAVEITEHEGPEDFTVKLKLDGKLLDTLQRGNGKGDDLIEVWQRATIDRAAGSILVQVYRPGAYDSPELTTDVVAMKSCTHVHKNPVRLEFYRMFLEKMLRPDSDSNDYIRDSSAGARDMLSGFVDPVIRHLRDKKVKVTYDVPSRKDPTKKSVMTAPLDDITTYDTLFDTYLKKLETPLSEHMSKEVVTEHEFWLKGPTLQSHVFHDKEAGTFSVQGYMYMQPLGPMHLQLHRDPLQLECWTINMSKEQIAGPAFYRFWRRDIHDTLAKCESWL